VIPVSAAPARFAARTRRIERRGDRARRNRRSAANGRCPAEQFPLADRRGAIGGRGRGEGLWRYAVFPALAAV
jgi:hypothetical protein